MRGCSSQAVMITCALVGAELTRQQAPYLPLTPQEIAESARDAVAAGATILHLHVRDLQGRPTCDEVVFSEVMAQIRSHCHAILQVSTGGALGDEPEDRFRPLKTFPEMASLTMGSINFAQGVFTNPMPLVKKLAQEMRARSIKPEIEIFDVSMLETALYFAQQSWLSWPLHLNFVLGVPGALSASEENLNFLISKVPRDCSWSVTAIGRWQFPMLRFALMKGGHIRVGMEDNLYLEKGVMAQSNAQLVEKAVSMAQALGRPIAGLSQAREILHLGTPGYNAEALHP